MCDEISAAGRSTIRHPSAVNLDCPPGAVAQVEIEFLAVICDSQIDETGISRNMLSPNCIMTAPAEWTSVTSRSSAITSNVQYPICLRCNDIEQSGSNPSRVGFITMRSRVTRFRDLN